MTDIENMEDVEEKKESWYAKLRASLKEKYEGRINDLEAQIQDLQSSNSATKKDFFGRILKAEGIEGDFNEFADKYSNLAIDEMVALYKGMNWVPAKVETQVSEPKVPEEPVWSQSVLGTNPTEVASQEDSVEKMDWKAYLEYLKRNMWNFGLG